MGCALGQQVDPHPTDALQTQQQQQQQQQQVGVAGPAQGQAPAGLPGWVLGCQALRLLAAAGWQPQGPEQQQQLQQWLDGLLSVLCAGAGPHHPDSRWVLLVLQVAHATQCQVDPAPLLSWCGVPTEDSSSSSSSSIVASSRWRGPGAMGQLAPEALVALLQVVCCLAAAECPQGSWGTPWLAVADAVLQQLGPMLPQGRRLQQLVVVLHQHRQGLRPLLTVDRVRQVLVAAVHQPHASQLDVQMLQGLAAAV
jgi:hypothetical protein